MTRAGSPRPQFLPVSTAALRVRPSRALPSPIPPIQRASLEEQAYTRLRGAIIEPTHLAGPAHSRGSTGAGVRDQPDADSERPQAVGPGAGRGLSVATRYLCPAFQQAGDGATFRGPGSFGRDGGPSRRGPNHAGRGAFPEDALSGAPGRAHGKERAPVHRAGSAVSLATGGIGGERAPHGGGGVYQHDVLRLSGRPGAAPRGNHSRTSSDSGRAGAPRSGGERSGHAGAYSPVAPSSRARGGGRRGPRRQTRASSEGRSGYGRR